MKNRTYWALGALVLLIIIVSVCYRTGKPSVETADTVDTPAETEQSAVQPRVKMPPQGESIATGHWEGDVWKRTVPPEPETVTHEGKTMTLRELLRAAYGSTDSWEERVAILNRVIAEAPYSDEAYWARDHLAKYKNGERIWDDALLFERLQPMLAYHPDESGLLYDLLVIGSDVNPESAIHYGKEILKYPEGGYRTHYHLAYPYQLIGDYSSALYHYKRSVELMRADPDRSARMEQIATEHIELILAGTPAFGPLARKERPGADAAGVAVSESASVGSESVPRAVPLDGSRVVPFFDADDADDLPMDSQQRGVDPRDLAKRAASERFQQVQQRAEQAQQRFDTFVKQLHQIATIKTEGDFEKFLTQELTKRLKGTKPSSEASKRPSVSADRMRRASQIFRDAQDPAEGLKKLREVDPDLAETLRRDPR